MSLKEKFKIIQQYFAGLDSNKENKDEETVFKTNKGIFGTSDTQTIFDFFMQIRLDKKKQFVDLGSGDGRVVIIAALFTKAIGIESDKKLHEESIQHAIALHSTAEFLQQDYETYDFSKSDILFSYADHFFTPSFIKLLEKEFSGSLFIYQGVFLPENLPKGRTYWVGQTPLISYEFSPKKTQSQCGLLIVNKDGEILLQMRDNNSSIPFSNRLGTFGGAIEAGETKEEAIYREISEEIEGYELKDPIYFGNYPFQGYDIHMFYVIDENFKLQKYKIAEGQKGIFIIEKEAQQNKHPFAFNCKEIVLDFFRQFPQ